MTIVFNYMLCSQTHQVTFITSKPACYVRVVGRCGAQNSKDGTVTSLSAKMLVHLWYPNL